MLKRLFNQDTMVGRVMAFIVGVCCIYGVVILLSLSGCEIRVNNSDIDKSRIHKTEFEGHDYLIYRNGVGGMTHDPNCGNSECIR